ncbi:ribonuclease HII [Aerococcaceae bacterium DSM 111021]|nr:ribonuclease HII [Aerococcaceae bacterium DSM 111021]
MSKMTINEIKELLFNEDGMDQNQLTLLKTDERKGVQKLLKQFELKKQKLEKELLDHQNRLQYEVNLYSNPNVTYIAGIDEVGRGPLAGPVVAASVILPQDMDRLVGINDSKTLSHAKRVQYADLIKEVALAYSVVEIDNNGIDKVNILEATKQAMLKSVNELPIKPNHLLIDALTLNTTIPQTEIIKGDERSISIAAASIIAKVHRDELMVKYHDLYPEFQFDKNMGYGTKNHLEALHNYGYTPIHRHSFSPVNNISFAYNSRKTK